MDKLKLGRNDLCPCGSGRKYKYCHIGQYDKYGNLIPPPQVIAMAEGLGNLPREPFEKGGFLTGRPFIDTEFKGDRIRAVKNRIHKRPLNETFHEFLLNLLADSLDRKWLSTEFQKPLEDRHTIVKWYGELVNQMEKKEALPEDSRVFGMKKTGNIRSLLALSYDFYSIFHCSGFLLPNLLKRLKSKEFFQGARYEIAMAGIAVRAGFNIEWVNDKEKHVEFKGIHLITKDVAMFEAKSHHREGVFDGNKFDPEKARIKIMDHIREALEQSPKDQPLIIFDDLNLPLSNSETNEKEWFKSVDEALKKYGFLEMYKKTNFGALYITNFSWHFHEDLIDMKENEVMALFHIGGNYSLKPQTLGLLDMASKQYGFVPSRLEEDFGIKNKPI